MFHILHKWDKKGSISKERARVSFGEIDAFVVAEVHKIWRECRICGKKEWQLRGFQILNEESGIYFDESDLKD